jgi:hypothetical protein
MRGIEEAAVEFGAACARPAVKEQDRVPFGISALLPVESMRFIDRERAGIEGLDGRVKIFVGHDDWGFLTVLGDNEQV